MRAFGDKLGFVGLHIADDVPHDVGQIRQLFRFAVPLLNIVLAEITLSGGVNFADAVWKESLTDGNQADGMRLPSRLQNQFSDTVGHLPITFLQHRHRLSPN